MVIAPVILCSGVDEETAGSCASIVHPIKKPSKMEFRIGFNMEVNKLGLPLACVAASSYIEANWSALTLRSKLNPGWWVKQRRFPKQNEGAVHASDAPSVIR